MSIYSKKSVLFRKIASSFIGLIFTFTIFVPPVRAEYIPGLPKPGEMVSLSTQFEPAVLKGLTIHPENPLAFDFIVDRGEDKLADEQFKQEADKLIKYFLAAMAIPEDKSWVNLSPYEKDRIIPDLLAQTQMGKQMLEQDYLLKQLSASLTNPDQELGKKFWDAVYKRAFELYGNTEVPISTFNKIWIVPQKAVVLEKDGHAYISESHLKVMMAEEYEALDSQRAGGLHARALSMAEESFTPSSSLLKKEREGGVLINNISSQIFRETILPAIEKEVNEGKNFAPVRQIYNSVILATWYKISLKESLLARVYADKGKIKGVDIPEQDVKQKVYDQYLQAFRQGVYSIIKENYDVAAQDVLPRKYFSGGCTMASSGVTTIIKTNEFPVVSSAAVTRLDTVDVKLVEPKESFYTTITPEHRAALEQEEREPSGRYNTITQENKEALKPAGLFKPLESKNKLTMSFEDGEVTLAYDQSNDTTYLVQITNDKLITQMMIPGKLTDTSLIFSAFNTAQDLRNWLNKNSALSLKLSFDQQGLFHTILAKALVAVDEDIDYKRNLQISNVLGLMEALSGTSAVANLTSLMDNSTPAQRQRILDKALSEFLVTNPDFILSAAHLLGVQSRNSDQTVEKPMNGGMVISSYSLEQDLSVLIIRRGINYSSYLVQGNIQSIRQAVDSFSTARELDDFLTEIKNARIPNSAYLSQYGHVFNGDYILSALTLHKISENDFKTQEQSPVNELVVGLVKDSSSGEGSLSDAPTVIAQQMSDQSPPERKKTFLKRLLPSFFESNFTGKISAGWVRFKKFLGGYSLHKTVIAAITSKEGVIPKEVVKKDGQIIVEFFPKDNKTSFTVSLKDVSLNSDPSTNTKYRYVFAGDLRALGMDNLSVKQINKLMAITQRNGFKSQQRVDLLNALIAAEFLEDSEFRAQGELGPKVLAILEPLNSEGVDIAKMYSEQMRDPYYTSVYLSGARAKGYFINEFLTAFLEIENRKHEQNIIMDNPLAAVTPLLPEDRAEFVSLAGAEVKIERKRGVLQIHFISQKGNIRAIPYKTYFVVAPGFDPQSLAQMITRLNKQTHQPLTGKELVDILQLANNERFSIFERGFIFQTLLAAAQFSAREFQKVEEVLKQNEDNIRTVIPKLGRALRVNMTSVVKSDGKMEIFYNPFDHKSYVRVESKHAEGKVKTTEHVLKGDFRNDHMDSAKSIQELEQQVLALAQDTALVQKVDGKMEILYEEYSNQSEVFIEYKSLNGELVRYDYTLVGDWRKFLFDSYRSVKEIQVQMAEVSKGVGLDFIQQQNLLRIVDSARSIKLEEFENWNINFINRILRLKSSDQNRFIEGFPEDSMIKFEIDDSRVRQEVFIQVLVSQLNSYPEFFQAVADQLGVVLQVDSADAQNPQSTAASSAAQVGGIDFDPALLNLQIKRDGRGIALPLPQQNLDQINIEGLYPVILNIQPVLMQDFPFVVSDRKSQPQIDLAVKK